jgi:uncharacterized protein
VNFCSRIICCVVFILTVTGMNAPASARMDYPLQNETPTGTLYGTLTLPTGIDKADIVVIQPGSGPVDRDGNLPGHRNNSLRMLSTALAERGIASLRIDKRGIGKNRAAGLDETKLRFEIYVDDFADWARIAGEQGSVGRVFLLGHSEGALIATLAALTTDVSGVILIAGSGVPAGRLIARQNDVSGAASSVRRKISEILGMLEFGDPYPNPPVSLHALFRSSIQPYLLSWFRYDPAAELGKLRLPVLIVQGSTDFQVWRKDADLLSAASPHAIRADIDGMNHILKTAPSDRRQNYATYNMPDLPLATGLVDVLADFIRQ